MRAGSEEVKEPGKYGVRNREVGQFFKEGVMPRDIKSLRKIQSNEVNRRLGSEYSGDPVK